MIPPGLYAVLLLFSASALSASVTSTAEPAAHGGVKLLLVSSYYDRLARAVQPQKLASLRGSNDGSDFSALPIGGAHLVGIAVRLSDIFGNPVISAIQPIFEARDGRSRGDVKGTAPDSLTIFAEAKPGYVVSELLISAQRDQVRAIKVVFRRLDIYHQTLVPGDMYESEWLGTSDSYTIVRVGDKRRPAIGLCGRAGDSVFSLGLLQAP